MKKIVFICLFSQFLFAQVFENIDLTKENGQDRIAVQIRLTSAEKAFELKLSPNVPVTLERAELGENSLWLKRTENNVEESNVLGWFQNDSGLVVHNNADVMSNSLMTLYLIADSTKIMRVNQLNIQMQKVALQNNQWQVMQDEQKISRILPLRKKDSN